jgi:polygalacturonase
MYSTGNPAIKLIGLRLHLAAFCAAAFLLPAPTATAVVPWTISINTNNTINVTNVVYGAKGDNATDNTTAIQNAINAAALGGKTNNLYGGTVEIPPGTNAYLCGPLILTNNINLQIDAGATLRMLPYGTYPGYPYRTNDVVADFISAAYTTNIEVSGGGAIDGQGAPYWPGYHTNNRPNIIAFDHCGRQLVQNVTLSNSPQFHMAFSNSKGNITVQDVTVRAPDSAIGSPPSHNTDACDVSGTNTLVQNCDISTGDDNFTCSGPTSDVLLTNNTYGYGHGVSIGSYTHKGGVSNITVINCTFNATQNGIRIKSDIGRGGLVQNINYLNLGMTNVNFPIQVYGYYNWYGTPSSITPAIAASTNAVSPVATDTPAFRNITFSNITATSVSTFPIGIIWARTEMPATNIVFNKVKITGDESFNLYNVVGAQFIDCDLKATNNSYATFALYNAQVIITNSAPANPLFLFDGLTTNGYRNTLALYNALGTLKNTNTFAGSPLTLSASTLTVSNNLNLSPAAVVNFTLSTNTTRLAVAGNLALGGTNNIYAGAGFTNGTYTLATMTGSVSGSLPVLGIVPPNYNYSLYLGVAAPYLLLNVTLLPPTNLVATASNLLINLKWNAVTGANTYSLKRGTTSNGPYPTIYSGLTATNYADSNVTNAVNYFYVVTATGAGGESSNSLQASAAPLPSNQPTNIVMQTGAGQLQLSWPQSHLGWRLQIQTNNLGKGIWTNWVTVPNSTNVIQTNIVINPTNGSVFLRLVYP